MWGHLFNWDTDSSVETFGVKGHRQECGDDRFIRTETGVWGHSVYRDKDRIVGTFGSWGHRQDCVDIWLMGKQTGVWEHLVYRDTDRSEVAESHRSRGRGCYVSCPASGSWMWYVLQPLMHVTPASCSLGLFVLMGSALYALWPDLLAEQATDGLGGTGSDGLITLA